MFSSSFDCDFGFLREIQLLNIRCRHFNIHCCGFNIVLKNIQCPFFPSVTDGFVRVFSTKIFQRRSWYLCWWPGNIKTPSMRVLWTPLSTKNTI